MTLQQQVQQHLQNTGISLRELSRRSGVSHTTIGKIVKGGTYKSDTANDLVFAMSFYGGDTARPVMQSETLHDKVEQLAAERVDHDKGWDVDLNCAKYRRVMQLEQQLNDANTAYLMSKSQHDRDLQRLSDANAEIKRLTALSETHAASWKAACVQVEQLQKQLDHGQVRYNDLYKTYSQQVDDEREMLAQIDKLFAERDNMRTEYEYRLMRLRVRCFALVCAIVFLIVSGLVLWGAV